MIFLNVFNNVRIAKQTANRVLRFSQNFFCYFWIIIFDHTYNQTVQINIMIKMFNIFVESDEVTLTSEKIIEINIADNDIFDNEIIREIRFDLIDEKIVEKCSTVYQKIFELRSSKIK